MKYFVLFLFSFSILNAQTPQLLKDIYPGVIGSYNSTNSLSEYIVGMEINGGFVFVGTDPTYGSELWFSNGSSAGTYLLKDIVPGVNSSDPCCFYNYNNKVYFSCNSNEWWCTDGTNTGTTLVKNIGVNNLIEIPNSTNRIFLATTPSTGTEMWITDGTTSGTVFLKDIWPGIGNSQISQIKATEDGKIFFRANDGVNGDELWVTDGTPQGTNMVKDVRLGSASSNCSSGFYLNGFYYFTANDGINGNEVWKTDGTDAGTSLFQNFSAGAANSTLKFIYLNNSEFIIAYTKYPDTYYIKTNGTNFDTLLIRPTIYCSNFFMASDGYNYYIDHEQNGPLDSLHFFKVDTTGTFIPILDTSYYVTDYTKIRIFEERDGKMIFMIKGFTFNNEIIGSISISNSKIKILSFNVTGYYDWFDYPWTQLPYYNDKWFIVKRSASTGSEYYTTDGDTITLLKDINPSGNSIDNNIDINFPFKHFIFNNELYLLADNGGTGLEIWKTDGTESGTVLVSDIYPGNTSFMYPIENGFSWDDGFIFLQTNDNVFFYANDGFTGREIWSLVNTPTGINQNISNSNFSCYPNPTKDELSVKLNEQANSEIDVKIIDVLGKEIKSLKIKAEQQTFIINTTELNNGFYFLSIQTKNKEPQIIKFQKMD